MINQKIPLSLGLAGMLLTLLLGMYLGNPFNDSALPASEAENLKKESRATSVRNTDSSPTSFSEALVSQIKKEHQEEDPSQETDEVILNQMDPRQSLDTILSEKAGSSKDHAMLALIEHWAKEDTQAAFDWLGQNAEHIGTNLPQLYSAIMGQHIIRDPESAKEMIGSMEAGTLKNTLAVQLAGSLAKTQVASALAWGESLEDPVARQQAMEVAVQSYSTQDPEGAFQYASSLSDSEQKAQMLSQVGHIMAGLDPEKISTNLERFPESTHAQLIPRIAWAWSQKDPQAAADWAEKIPTGPIRDQAIREANWKIVAADPKRSFQLAATVTNPAMRYGLVRDALKAWHQMDPQTAQEALTNLDGFSEMQRDYLKADLIQNAAIPDLVLPN